MMSQFVCIGVPYWLGERITDRSEVASVKASGIADELGARWVDITPDFAVGVDPVVAVNRALAEAITTHGDKIPIIFASDCTSALGALKGLERHNPAVLWYDAHGDFNTPETTLSGFLGGMPLAMLVGRGNERLMQGVGLVPLNERDVLITDARDLDPAEGVLLRQSNLTHLRHVNELLDVPLPQKPLYIHLDVDVVDSAEMPAMNYPASGGPSLDQVAATLDRVAREGQGVGILLSLWNGAMEGADVALQNTLRLLRALVGGMQ
jgi:arginase